jgi:hypothetical protein
MSHDPKYDAPEFPITVVCQGCGHELTDHNTACQACDRCDECMPGDCWECKELRREDQGERLLRLSKEARTW